jgi:hypothetical protein
VFASKKWLQITFTPSIGAMFLSFDNRVNAMNPLDHNGENESDNFGSLPAIH